MFTREAKSEIILLASHWRRDTPSNKRRVTPRFVDEAGIEANDHDVANDDNGYGAFSPNRGVHKNIVAFLARMLIDVDVLYLKRYSTPLQIGLC